MRGLSNILSVVLMAWQTSTVAQEAGKRDLLDPFDAAAPPQTFAIEFRAGGQTLEELTPQGQVQLEQALAAIRAPAWAGRALILEGYACVRGAAGAEYEAVCRRAAAVRDFPLSHQAAPPESICLAVYGRPAGSAAESEEQHARHGQVYIRPWGEEQMAELAEYLLPPPPRARIAFLHRPRGAGAFRSLQQGGAVRSGDEFQIMLAAEQIAYAYVFHRGSGGNWVCLFPASQPGASANPLEPGREYWLPRPEQGFTLDDTPGQEETFVYLSEKPQAQLESWAVEGVPWQVVADQRRGLESTVRVESPARHINWYRRLAFEHQTGLE